MNKVTKIGLTALCGSLAAVAANAGSMSVSGGAALTWTSESAAVSGNPIGMKNNLTFGAAGELDNGYSWTMNAYQSDANTLTSSTWSMNMDTLGSIKVDFGAGGVGLDALDDKMPTAWEETHGTGSASGLDTITGVHGSAAIQWSAAADMLPMGTSLAIAFTPKADGGGLQADLGNSGDLNNEMEEGWDIVVQSGLGIDGLNVFAGSSVIEKTGTGEAEDKQEHTIGATYAVGAVTVGYQEMTEDPGTTTGTDHYDSMAYGISFNVNDNLALSFGHYESERENAGAANVELELDSIQMSYNMGGASIKIASTDVDNASYSSGSKADTNTVALSLAF